MFLQPFRVRFPLFILLVNILVTFNMPVKSRPLVLSSSLRVPADEVTANVAFRTYVVPTESRRQAVINKKPAPHVGKNYAKPTAASAHRIVKNGDLPLSADQVARSERLWNGISTRTNKKKVHYAAPTQSWSARNQAETARPEQKRSRPATGQEGFLKTTAASSHKCAKDGEVPLSALEAARGAELWKKIHNRPNAKVTGYAAPTATSSARQRPPCRPARVAAAAATSPVPAGGQ